jgi:phage gpG-like protein
MPGDLSPLRNDLGYYGSPELVVDLRGALAAEGERQLLRGFFDSVDPYGNDWAPVARPGKPLILTNQLRSSRVAAPTSTGITVGLAADYASFQQLGTKGRRKNFASARARSRNGKFRRVARVGGITPRPMIPDGRGIGPVWGAAFERVTLKILARHGGQS